MTGKQRAKLRGMVNAVEPILHIGKEGITENILAQASDALEARELVKGTVLKNCDLTARQALDILTKELGAEPVQAIGRKFSLYRRSKKNRSSRFKRQ